ncbi:MAG: MFS transporter [Patescibacteria group bacterium]
MNTYLALKNNIWKLYIVIGLRWFMIIMPIIVLFYNSIGLALREVFIIQAVFSATIVILEIPSGYWADIFGRRKSIIIGTCLAVLGMAIYSVSYDFYSVLIAEIILGVGASFVSGADSALLYDSLAEMKKIDDYKKSQGRLYAVENFSEGLAAVLAGFLAVISLRLPLYVETIAFVIALPFAFSLVEPARQAINKTSSYAREMIKIIKLALHEHKELKWLIIYSAVTGATTFTFVWFVQPYWSQVGLPLPWFGILWAVLQFSVGLFSWVASWYENKVGRRFVLISFIFIAAAAYLGMGLIQSLWGLVFMLLPYFVRGINKPLISDYVNKIISSESRATVLSIKNLGSRIIFVIIGPLVGWVSDVYSLSTALFLCAALFLILGLGSLVFLHKHNGL